MSGQTLFDYQQRFVDELLPDALRRGFKRICMESCCGSGKTTMMAELCRRAASKGNTVSVIAHRRKLIKQIAERINSFGVRYTIEMAELPDEPWVKRDPGADVIIGSMQTMFSRLETSGVRPSKIVIPDEAHTINSKAYSNVLSAIRAEYLIGPTATPCNPDGSGFGPNVFDHMIRVTSIEELIARDPQRLVATDVFAPVGVGKRRRKGLQAGVSGDPVQQWFRHAEGLRTITFCRTLAECRSVVEMFQADGVTAVHIDANTDPVERDETIRQLEAGEISVIVCTPSLMGVGVDIPLLECVQTLTKNHSPVAHWQLLGRGQRAAEGKTRAVLLDHAAAVYTHGSPNQSPVWTLDANDSVQRKTQERMEGDPSNCKPNVCQRCGCVSVGSPKCPKCNSMLFVQEKKETATEREPLQQFDGNTGDGPNPKWLSDWRGFLYQAATMGTSIAMASSQFKRKYGVWPERAGVHPVAPYEDRQKKVSELFPQFVRRKRVA